MGPLLVLVTSVTTGLGGVVICIGSCELSDVRLNMFACGVVICVVSFELSDVRLNLFACGVVICVVSFELSDVRLNMFVRSDLELIEGSLVL